MADPKKPTSKAPASPPARLSYCDKCKPPVPLGIGHTNRPASHVGKNGETHEGKMVAIDSADLASIGGDPKGFLDRMMKKYVVKS